MCCFLCTVPVLPGGILSVERKQNNVNVAASFRYGFDIHWGLGEAADGALLRHQEEAEEEGGRWIQNGE